ncbi:MAG: hypothetical protein H6718_17200 [Polyangiaceae bacterium]|nr:hypothetical protein [Myxococcales bacterium]MCB9587139.1 hypothetical protein [Polyangiaceae bacterium]
MRATTFIAAAAVIGLLAPLPIGLRSAKADGLTSRPDVMPVKDIKPGMKGYGLTVFKGTKPEKFEVEVIDVLKNFQPRQELILIKTKHPRLEVAKVVAGMSGSPIYINNKMIGAYAYGWTFGREPVAGVTPIGLMLDDLVRPLPKQIDGWPLHALPKAPSGKAKQALKKTGSQQRFAGKIQDYDLTKHAEQIGKAKAAKAPSETTGVRPVTTPIMIGGMTTGAIEVARELFAPLGLEPLQAGGSSGVAPGAPTRFEDGGAVGVELIRGDMSGMGLGTVTRVEGDKLVAFGHPMMMSGNTALPTTIGRVLHFMASVSRSFKIGESVRPMGTLVNDRQASIVVDQTLKAPTFPVSLKIKGVPGNPFSKWDFEVAHEKFMTPSFVAVALGSAMQAVAAENQDISWNATSKLKIKGYGEIELEDFGVSVGGSPSPRDFIGSNLVRAIGAVMNNPWEYAFIEGVTMEIEFRFAREIYMLKGTELLDPEVDAGQSARIRLTLMPWAGKEITRVIKVPLPKDLAGQTVSLSLSPGYTHYKTKAPPNNLGELIKNFEDPIYPPKSLIVSYSAKTGGVAYKGMIAEDLPPGAMDMIRPTQSSIAPSSFSPMVRQVVPLPLFMVGGDRVDVKVRPVIR